MKFEIDPNELTTDQRAHVAAFITNWPVYSEVSNLLKEILDAPETEEFKMAKRAGGIAGARNLSEEQRLDAEQKRDMSGLKEIRESGEVNLNQIFGAPVDTAGDLTLTVTADERIETNNLVPLDSQGLPWDSRIHASTKTFIADGSWKLRRGVDPAEVENVKAQLKALMAVPAHNHNDGVHATGHVDFDPASRIPAPVLTPTEVGYVPVPPTPKSHYLIDIPVPGIDVNIPSNVPVPVTLTDLIGRMSAAITVGKITQATVTEICVKHGVSEFILLSSRPDLIPLIDADMKAMGV